MSDFEPEIVAMCCNWCGYAGADLAGVSRVQYPPNIHIIRVMCSARVEPAHIIRTLEMGADGVMVLGCHPGDCHYISGNERAAKTIDATRAILRPLGMDGRVRLEWISAAEGVRFGEVVTTFTELVRAMGPNPMRSSRGTDKNGRNDANGMNRPSFYETARSLEAIIESTNVLRCVECGKCAASCPVTAMELEYSPMMTVVRASRGFVDEVVNDKGVWTCKTCGTCSSRCPTGADYLEFIRQVRQLRAGVVGTCSHGGMFNAIARMHASPDIRQVGRLDWLKPDMSVAKRGDLLYFTGCLPYLDPAFKEMGADMLGIARSTVRVLNAAGLRPVLLPDERCCGHDQLWNGEDPAVVESLARQNIEMIRRSGAKRVVASCPECYRTLAKDYPKHAKDGELGFEVMHTSQLYAELIEEGSLHLDEEAASKVVATFQDPCRLGRHMGEFDAPRKVLDALPSIELREMLSSKANAVCCGTSAWMNCDTYSKRIQVNRLREAKDTGSSVMVTACPKCLIHFNCTLTEPPIRDLPPKPDISVKDLSVAVAEAMGLRGGAT